MKNIIKTNIISCLFLLTSSYFCFSQQFSQQKADSILTLVKNEEDSFEKIKLLTSNAGRNRYTTITFQLIEKAISISKEEGIPLLLAHSYYAKGNYYYFASKTDSSLAYLNKAEKYALKSNDRLLKPQILATKSGIYKKLGALILAISTNIEAKELLDKIDTLRLSKKERFKLKGQQLVLNNSLANLYNKIENYEKALSYYNIAFENALSMKEMANASIILGNKGDLLIKMNKAEDAISVLQKSKKMKEQTNLPKRFIGTSYLNLGTAYSQLKEYNNALKFFDTAYTIFVEQNYPDGIMRVSTNRGLLYNNINRYDLALLDCAKGKKIALETNDSEYTYKSCNCLYKANKNLGNYTEALANHEQYTAIKDSLFNEKNIRKITQVGMQYEFDKKNAEQELLIEKRKHQRNQVLAGLAVLLLAFIGTFIFFKKRIKYQKTIATQNSKLQQQRITELQQKNKLTALNSMIEGQEAERLRIAKDLHDGLGGLLSTIKAHFTGIQNQCHEVKNIPIAKKTNQLIDEACLEVRRVSHNMMPHSLNISGLEGAFEDLTEHLKQQGYNATLETHNLPKNIDETKKIMLYRIAQEVISNIRKHANASTILLQLIGHKNELTLTIEDDGKGFIYEKAIKKSGVGIKNINSRVSFLDGAIVWDAQLKKGTTITINIPL